MARWWSPTASRREALLFVPLVVMLVAVTAEAQVIEVLEGATYGPVVMLPETEVIFGYTILCAAGLPWRSRLPDGRRGLGAFRKAGPSLGV